MASAAAVTPCLMILAISELDNGGDNDGVDGEDNEDDNYDEIYVYIHLDSIIYNHQNPSMDCFLRKQHEIENHFRIKQDTINIKDTRHKHKPVNCSPNANEVE